MEIVNIWDIKIIVWFWTNMSKGMDTVKYLGYKNYDLGLILTSILITNT